MASERVQELARRAEEGSGGGGGSGTAKKLVSAPCFQSVEQGSCCCCCCCCSPIDSLCLPEPTAAPRPSASPRLLPKEATLALGGPALCVPHTYAGEGSGLAAVATAGMKCALLGLAKSPSKKCSAEWPRNDREEDEPVAGVRSPSRCLHSMLRKVSLSPLLCPLAPGEAPIAGRISLGSRYPIVSTTTTTTTTSTFGGEGCSSTSSFPTKAKKQRGEGKRVS